MFGCVGFCSVWQRSLEKMFILHVSVGLGSCCYNDVAYESVRSASVRRRKTPVVMCTRF